MLEDRLHIGIAIKVATDLLEVLRLHTLIAIGTEARHRREGKLLLRIGIELAVQLDDRATPALDEFGDLLCRHFGKINAIELLDLVIRPRPFVLVVVEVQVGKTLL